MREPAGLPQPVHPPGHLEHSSRVPSGSPPSCSARDLVWSYPCAASGLTTSDNRLLATRIVLVRHAAIDTGRRLCGSLDISLSAVGRAELEALLRRPARADVPDALFTSTLQRATTVARALGRVWTIDPQPVAWAREIHCGDVEGMPLDQLRRCFSELWARNEAQREDTFSWPGGETYAEFRGRVVEGLDDAAARYPSGRVVIVTHAGVISQVLGRFKNRAACVWKPDRPDPLTATEVLWTKGAPRAVLSFNDRDWY
jgi:broad specificity phosphatase PhoE